MFLVFFALTIVRLRPEIQYVQTFVEVLPVSLARARIAASVAALVGWNSPWKGLQIGVLMHSQSVEKWHVATHR